MRIIQLKIKGTRRVRYYIQDGERYYSVNTNWSGRTLPFDGEWQVVAYAAAPKIAQKAFDNMNA